ncbi:MULTISPECIES: hypothetical protein [unclassified Algibacter]|uniref:hypothetical protein n=1 Tax=unclassified Algibacter TaxID=2615009 RepID=UPI00131AD03B|nr:MULTISPECIES: hypothetical protein [unclassified Algibacter]MCL5127045.1 hypothetical protein [Algibacter sp. L4_22]
MSRNLVSIFFLFAFLVFLSAPTVIAIVNDSVDISLFFSMAEEEENGNPKIKNIKDIILENLDNEDFVSLKQEKNHLNFYVKKYSKPYLNLISPPPKFS